MTALLAIPEPQSVDLERAHNLAQQITEWAGTTESIPELEDARARVAAIEVYIRKRDAQAAAALAAADRRLEVRIGELLGNRQGERTDLSPASEKSQIPRQQAHQFRQMAEHKEDPEVADAIENGASRSEVLRRIDAAKAKHPPTPGGDSNPARTLARVKKARKMATDGYTSRQIAKAIGIKEEGMADFRKRHAIEVPADEVVGKTRRIDAVRVITEAVHTLDGLAMSLDLVDPADVDSAQLKELAELMAGHLRQIARFHKRMKEEIQ